MHDPASLEAICDAAAVGPEDTVLEIGPGLGTLTTKLVARAKKVVAVEFDTELAKHLATRVPATNLEVLSQDILRFDLSTLPAGYKIVANIPYYLTSNLLRVLVESPTPFAQAALLVQKEVAERVCEHPGNMNLLAVCMQYYCEVRLGAVVPAKLFTPPPKVDSQVLVLTYRPEPLYPDVNVKEFFRIAKAGFAQRRKTLLNSLGAGLHLSREQAGALLENVDIPPATRAQSLTLDDWYALYEAYQDMQ